MLTHRTRTINDGDGPPFDFFEVDLRVYTPRTIYKVLVGIQTKAIRLNTHNAADHFIRSFRLRNAPTTSARDQASTSRSGRRSRNLR